MNTTTFWCASLCCIHATLVLAMDGTRLRQAIQNKLQDSLPDPIDLGCQDMICNIVKQFNYLDESQFGDYFMEMIAATNIDTLFMATFLIIDNKVYSDGYVTISRNDDWVLTKRQSTLAWEYSFSFYDCEFSSLSPEVIATKAMDCYDYLIKLALESIGRRTAKAVTNAGMAADAELVDFSAEGKHAYVVRYAVLVQNDDGECNHEE